MVTLPRVEKLKGSIKNVLEGYDSAYTWFEFRVIASVVGQIIAMQTVLCDDVRLRTMYSYYCILNRSSWNSDIRLSKEAVSELRFWALAVEEMNKKGTSLSQMTESNVEKVVLYCDASDTGFGGHLTLYLQCEQTDCEWNGVRNEWESKQSSTWRNLKRLREF